MSYRVTAYGDERPTLKHTEARATARQARYLDDLNRRLPRETAWGLYEQVVGQRFDALPPTRRFSHITRGQASALIEAYRAA
jgi:hypothetical protein